MARQLKDAKVQIWVTAKEKALLELVADRQNTTMSDLARRLLRKGLADMVSGEEDAA